MTYIINHPSLLFNLGLKLMIDHDTMIIRYHINILPLTFSTVRTSCLFSACSYTSVSIRFMEDILGITLWISPLRLASFASIASMAAILSTRTEYDEVA